MTQSPGTATPHTPPRITPLDAWATAKIGQGGDKSMLASGLARYQAERLRWVIRYARANSPFYRDRLSGLPDGFPHRLEDMCEAPFTTETDLRKRNLDMLCVSQGEVARVVTLQTSGATNRPKRLYFTKADLELTTDFFHHGMTTLARPGARVLILMPGRTPGSIGDLLQKGLKRMNVESLVHGPVMEPDRAVDDLLKFRADCLVGLPAQVLSLVRATQGRHIPRGLIKSVLLSADYVPGAIVEALERRWGAPIFEHYGMTEMGLGGGVQCEVRDGYHLREADLYFEVVDPVSGAPKENGQVGEVVFTTLTRRGMPLIRYRTGDLARFLTEPCPCGSALRRLGKVRGRINGLVRLRGGGTLNLPEMDEVLFRVPGLINFRAEIRRRDGRDCLCILVHASPENRRETLKSVEKRLIEIPSIEAAVTQGRLMLGPVSGSPSNWPTNGTIKRILVDKRLENEAC